MVFKTRELVFIALMGALLASVNILIGSGVIAVTGIPAGSTLVTGISNTLAITVVALTLKKLPSVTLMYLIYGFITLPTHLGGGPPGFLWKIPMLVFFAFVMEICLWFGNYKKSSFFIGLLAYTVVGIAGELGLFYLLGMPEYDKLLAAVPILAAAFIVLGSLGIWIGFNVYNRIKNKNIVLQISN